MKELSIEEKAKAYDKVLDRAKEWLNIKEPFSDTCTCVVESIFPELKESEDEKIRKDIIYFLSRNTFQFGEDIDKYKSWIAWLEKQGESVKSRWKPSKEQLEAFNHFVRSIGESGYASPYDNNTKLLYSLLHDLEQLEKQNEQEPFDYENATIQQKDFAPKSVIEATKEEMVDNTNKVEPKFDVDDWVVRKDGKNFADGRKTVRITRFDGERYWFDSGTYLQPKDIRLWNISDAKAGDVLYSPCLRLLWIFKSKDTVYCGCNLNYNDGAFCGEAFFIMPTDATPATKAQRDLLFQKMKEAGYEWNFNDKELIKK